MNPLASTLAKLLNSTSAAQRVIKALGPDLSCDEQVSRLLKAIDKIQPLPSPLEKQIYHLIPSHLRESSREWLGFIPTFAQAKVGRFVMVEAGTRTHVNVDPLELFARILPLRPFAVHLIHNHPSGNPHASEEDLQLTRAVEFVLDQFGIELARHWIVTTEGIQAIEKPCRH